MQKPQGWENTAPKTGEYEILPPGNYECQILDAREETSNKGNNMLVIQFDISEGEYKGYFNRQYSDSLKSRPDTKYQGVYRQLTEGGSIGYFKGMIAAIEESNQPYIWNWDESALKGKKFAGMFRREEYEKNDGTIGASTRCAFVRSLKALREGKLKVLPDKKISPSTQGKNSNSYYPDVPPPFGDDDIPF